MFLVLIVTLFTTRILINSLGVQDYGIFNVVGGIVILLSFLSSAMASSTQRFLSFEIGRKDFKKLNKTFSMSVNIHILIGLVVFLLLEIIGLWFLQNYLNIPENRLDAATTVFHFSSLSLLITIVAIPYYACILANEKMNIFAYFGIIEVLLKLGIALLIQTVNVDKLKLYGVLMFSATAIIQVSYIIYSRNSFKETRYLFFWDRSLFYKIISFAGWSLFGSFATVLKNQGVNIILNMFFGPTVNASKAVAAQVEGATSSFVSNIQTAIKPQIIKSYAINNISYLNTLVFTGAKFSYYLILCISLPIILETEYVLQIWLKTVPEYSVMFVRLSLIIVLIDTLSVTLMSSIQATGRIRLYQVVISSLLISILPISFVFLKMGYPPTIAYFVSLVVFVIILVARISIVSKYVKFSISDYLKNVVLISLLVTVISFMIPYIIVYSFDSSIKRLVFTILFSILSVVLTVYFVGMDKIEKEKIIFIIRNFNAK